MKIRTKHKFYLFLGILVTAVALCALPFLLVEKDTIYVYTEQTYPTQRELGFVRELQKKELKVILNSTHLPPKDSYGLWFKSPEYAEEIAKSPAKINFLYTEAYYPISWYGLLRHPVVLTPYKEIYEHYMRSNIKSAMMILGADNAKFYNNPIPKKYPLVYYGNNNKNSPIADYLQNIDHAKFLGSFWKDNKKTFNIDIANPEEIRDVLNQTQIVVVYNAPDSSQSRKIPEEIVEATISGALVFSSPNKAVTENYGENVIIYNDIEDFVAKLEYYLKNIENYQDKIFSAQNISTQKFNSAASVQRFIEIFDWLKRNPHN